jgi:3-deoxy-D-manno-octulosonate 8-phosphate phosphatase (KDO 8-P phosphatase)
LQGISDKRAAFEQVLAQEGLKPEEAAYIGDDVIDLPVMRTCGLAFSVPNGRAEAKREAHVFTDHAGGEGALRDAIVYILRAQGKLEATIEAYLHASDAVAGGQ